MSSCSFSILWGSAVEAKRYINYQYGETTLLLLIIKVPDHVVSFKKKAEELLWYIVTLD